MESADARERFLALGLEPAFLPPDDFADFLNKQNDRYKTIVRQLNIKID